MKLFQVTQVRVLKQSESPLTLCIQVSGLAASSGWTNPRLDNSADPNPADAVLVFSFEADVPTGVRLPVLTPISAAIEVTPANGADAVIVSARSNELVVHASCFLSPAPPNFTTLALGEEGPMMPPPVIGPEEPVTTLALGEEGPFPSTRALGEEGPFPSTRALGEESPPTTLAIGEEGPIGTTKAVGEEEQVTTLALGEEGPVGTTEAVGEEEQVTTLALGEETGWGGPFGRF